MAEEYYTTRQLTEMAAAARRPVTESYVGRLCRQGRIERAVLLGRPTSGHKLVKRAHKTRPRSPFSLSGLMLSWSRHVRKSSSWRRSWSVRRKSDEAQSL